MNKKLIIKGTSSFAEIAHEYFTQDSEYEVVGFAVNRDYIDNKEKFSLPVTAIEDIQNLYEPKEHHFFVAITYTKMNRLRNNLLFMMIEMGFKPASYISKNAFIAKSAIIGEHNFIMENNTVQPFVKLESNVILWSGNHIGHHSILRKNTFISSHVVISGHCEIGENCFLGVNCTISNNTKIDKDCWIGPATLIEKNTNENQIIRAETNIKVSKVSTKRYFKL